MVWAYITFSCFKLWHTSIRAENSIGFHSDVHILQVKVIGQELKIIKSNLYYLQDIKPDYTLYDHNTCFWSVNIIYFINPHSLTTFTG